MKKIMLVLALSAIVLGGCSNSSKDEDTASTPTPTAAATEAPTEAPKQSAGKKLLTTGNPAEIALADIAEKSGDAANAWIKVATQFDKDLTVFDTTSLPAGTVGIVVDFKVSNFDLGESTLYWCYQMISDGNTVAVWDTSSPTDTLTITADGSYRLVYDVNTALGGALDMIESFQMVFPCTMETTTVVTLTGAVCYTDAEEFAELKSGAIE